MTPSEIVAFLNNNGVSMAIIAFVMWFLTFRLWPWYTKEFYPAVLARERAEENERTTLREAINALNITVQGIPAALQMNLSANVQQSLAPQISAITNHFEASLNTAREASVQATATRLDPMAQTLSAIQELLRTHTLESKIRHDAMLGTIATMGNELTTVFLGLHGPSAVPLRKPPVPEPPKQPDLLPAEVKP